MTRGEKIGVFGMAGMMLMTMIADGTFCVPAIILFCAFGIIAFAAHLIPDEGFLDAKEIDKEKIERNREEVWNSWVSTGKIR